VNKHTTFSRLPILVHSKADEYWTHEFVVKRNIELSKIVDICSGMLEGYGMNQGTVLEARFKGSYEYIKTLTTANTLSHKR